MTRVRPGDRRRAARRAALDVLLARAQRGVLTPAEAAALAAHVRAEQHAADACRTALGQTAHALDRARAGADETICQLEAERDDADQAAAASDAARATAHRQTAADRQALDRYRAAWQSAGRRARTWRGHAETATARAWDAEQHLAAAHGHPLVYDCTPENTP